MLSFKNVNIISILILIILIYWRVEYALSIWWFVLLLAFWLTLTIIGSFHIRWNYFLKAKNYNYKVKENVVALTFDDGPNPKFTPKVLDLLIEFNAKATFFCIGKNAEKYPDLVERIISEEHVIGNHSFSHTNNYGFLSTRKVKEDIQRGQHIFKDLTNLDLKLFRPPFGVTNPNISKALKELNLNAMGWSIRSLDTIAKNPDKVFKKITKDFKKGDVILLHDTNELSLIVLKQLLLFLKENKVKTITLDKLFNINAYES